MNLVVGSSGMLGGMIARKLLARGESVRVMVRQSSALDGVESILGDIKDPTSLAAACHGATALRSWDDRYPCEASSQDNPFRACLRRTMPWLPAWPPASNNRT